MNVLLKKNLTRVYKMNSITYYSYISKNTNLDNYIKNNSLRSKTIKNKKYSGIYWNPVKGNNPLNLNDYQYIKCKWIFELLTGGYTIINKDYGFILNVSFLKSLIKNNELNQIKVSNHKYSSNWVNELLGEYSKLYYSVLSPKTPRLKLYKRN
jgi:hypothetical protein